MTSFMTPQRAEPPRQRVLITQVDTTALTAVGSNLSNRGKVNIDISIHSGQTIVYPRENEEWLITKVNETWVLDKKSGFGNEGLLREANPGDLVTVTTGDYYLDSGSNQFVADSSFDGHLIANADLSVWGNSDLGPVQVYGRLDLVGDLDMNGYNIYTEGGFIRTAGGSIETGGGYIDTKGGYLGTSGGMIDAAGGQLWAGQIVGQQNSYFDKLVRTVDLHVTGHTQLGRMDVYGDAYHHGWGIDLQGGGIGASVAVIGGVGIASNGVYPAGKGIWNAGTVDAAWHQSGGAGFNGGGFYVGNSWIDGGGVGGPGCSFGGVGINGGGINTGWRNIDAGFGAIYAGIYYQNISEVGTKQDITPVQESQLDAVLAAPLYHFRYKPEVVNNLAAEVESDIGVLSPPEAPDIPVPPESPDDPPVVGPQQTSDIPISDPDPLLVTGINSGIAEEIAETWRIGPMVEDLPDQVVGDTPRGKAPDLSAMVNTLWGAVHELNGKLEAANERIASLTHRLEAVGG